MITAKELAKIMGLSEAAVSMALRNKPGVSTQTRRNVIEMAEKHGYDFSRTAKHTAPSSRNVTFAIYKRHGSVVGETPFFSELSEGIGTACAEGNFKLNIAYIHKGEDVEKNIEDISYSDCVGVILLGTEMQAEDFIPFGKLRVPIVVLDLYLDTLEYDCVLINNAQGAQMAADYLINRTKKQPGYLRSSYTIGNFDERADGFYKSIRRHGMSASKSIVHKLTPSIEGAYADMLEIIERGEELAQGYFADNDWIAIGAMKALQKKGYKIPEDIAVVGFDNVPMASYIEPTLTTVHVHKKPLGELAARRLIEIVNNGVHVHIPCKIEMTTNLRKRRSC